MMRYSNCKRADDPLARFRASWRSRARTVKDTWLPGTLPIESALESTFREGVAFAAELLEKEGHRELAGRIRARVQRAVYTRRRFARGRLGGSGRSATISSGSSRLAGSS